MQNKVLNGVVYELCEIYIDDVLILRDKKSYQPQINQSGSQGGRIRWSPSFHDGHLIHSREATEGT